MSEVNKIANYNQMMSWLTRPASPKQPETREDFAIGGGSIVGENLGTREGFDAPRKIKVDDKALVNEWRNSLTKKNPY